MTQFWLLTWTSLIGQFVHPEFDGRGWIRFLTILTSTQNLNEYDSAVQNFWYQFNL